MIQRGRLFFTHGAIGGQLGATKQTESQQRVVSDGSGDVDPNDRAFGHAIKIGWIGCNGTALTRRSVRMRWAAVWASVVMPCGWHATRAPS